MSIFAKFDCHWLSFNWNVLPKVLFIYFSVYNIFLWKYVYCFNFDIYYINDILCSPFQNINKCTSIYLLNCIFHHKLYFYCYSNTVRNPSDKHLIILWPQGINSYQSVSDYHWESHCVKKCIQNVNQIFGSGRSAPIKPTETQEEKNAPPKINREPKTVKKRERERE